MRKLLGVVLVAVLLPGVLAAQGGGTPGEQVGRKVPVFLTASQAQTAALQAVRAELAKGTFLHTWPVKTAGTPIPPATVKSAGALFNPTGGKNGTPVWVVGVASPNGQGTLRVLVDARTGAVVPGGEASSFSWGMWSWGMAPAYWQQGLNSPPPARTNSPPPAKSN